MRSGGAGEVVEGLGEGTLMARVPAAITDTGCEREINEDRYDLIDAPSAQVWVVCDGMGGSTGGELAAQIAIDVMRRELMQPVARTAADALRDAVREANRVIVLRRQNQAFASMGTTVVAMARQGAEVVLGSVGDSRAYVVHPQGIKQLTTDHTYVQQLVEKGVVSPEEALSHPQAHILTRCLGAEAGIEVDLDRWYVWRPEDGARRTNDMLVLCSDGLYSLVADVELAAIVNDGPPQTACARLVELARQRGGFDNITVAIVPLGGELRSEPPAGFVPMLVPVAATMAEDGGGERSGHWVRLGLLLFLLCSLSILVTVLVMAVSLSQ